MLETQNKKRQGKEKLILKVKQILKPPVQRYHKIRQCVNYLSSVHKILFRDFTKHKYDLSPNF